MLFDDGLRYRLFSLLAADPEMSQRGLAKALGISLGKVNYCLNALIANGWVKAKRFRHNENKLGYAYVLTPDGIEEKAELTLQFLHRKLAEYEALEEEIRELRQEAEEQRSLRREIAPLGLE
jgi:EPS-associated MarR family transcriptional regulator